MAEEVLLQPNVRRLHTNELVLAETWLWEKVQANSKGKRHFHRLRMWCIFMLLRYAALRVVEITRLPKEAIDFAQAMVHIENSRDVPIPHQVTHRLKNVWHSTFFFSLDMPLQCDPSLIRRTFQQCSSVCGLPKGILTARTLRWNRAYELLCEGVPAQAVDFFLGRTSEPDALLTFDRAQVADLLREHIHKGEGVKTSARNVFQGRIVHLEKSGLLVKVVLRTAGGLHISAVITDTSFTNLGLTIGSLVIASIKAPWVVILAPDQKSENPTDNTYQGTIEQVRKDDFVTEVLVELEEGSQVCALCDNASSSEALSEGQKVTVYFKAFSVILTVN
ncbi:MAG: TOBE domain-containing protein [Desulfovibrionaceae bacterium]|nr:TOBE domain-containing protein [Desulfovibrionaceae bacterium]